LSLSCFSQPVSFQFIAKALISLFLVFGLLGCNESDDSEDGGGSNTPITYTVSFYELFDLHLAKRVSVEPNTAIELIAGSKTTWYKGGSDTPLSGEYNVTGNINFYGVKDVIEISDQAGLASIACGGSKRYILINDIALSGNWTPLCSAVGGGYFNGLLQGDFHKITGLNVVWNADRGPSGLFGWLDYPAQIHNLGVIGAHVEGAYNVGIIAGTIFDDAGYTMGVSLTNSYATGTVIATPPGKHDNESTYAGGIVGVKQFLCGAIKGVYFNGSVKASGRGSGIGSAGGIAGSGHATDSYSAGSVVGDYAGGIAGYGSANRCYSTANVNGIGIAGGIVAQGRSSEYNVDRDVAINQAISGATVGRIAGKDAIPCDRWNCANTLVPNIALDSLVPVGSIGSTSLAGENKTQEELKQQKTYEDIGWKFGANNDNPWNIDEGSSYPYLYWQK
jgi:hypothetical protein